MTGHYDVYCGCCGGVWRVKKSDYKKGEAGCCPFCQMVDIKMINQSSQDIPQKLSFQ